MAYAPEEYQEEIDSVYALISDNSRPDTVKAKDYIELSKFYFRRNVDTTVAICEEGLKFIDGIHYKLNPSETRSLQLSRSRLFMNIGFAHYYLNKLDFSIKAILSIS